jgi:hypothetical protein
LVPNADTHIGLTWFSPPLPEVEAEVAELWDEATAASTVGRVLIDWVDVEPSEGSYNFDELDDQLDDMVRSGRRPMVTIAAVDTSGTEFPEWLGQFRPEPAADAYVAMVEQLLPVLRRHDVWLLAVANEPPLADDDDLNRNDFATFVERIEAELDVTAPDIPISFTFAGGDPFIDDPAIDRLVNAVDAYSVNHYCLDVALMVRPLDEVGEAIDAHVERAGDLPIVFQEFGCPAGELLGSSEDYQLAWFQQAFDHIGAIDQVRAAFVFEFLDWSEQTWDLDYGDAEDGLVAEVGEGYVARFRDWLLTSGLVAVDGTTRPAFDHFIEVAGSTGTP